MRSIDDVVVRIEGWERGRSRDRDQVLKGLDALSATCDEAIEVWKRYLDNPGAAGDKWTAVSWVGAERAQRLHELNLRSGELLHQMIAIAGSDAARFVAYEDSIIEMAYRQLGPGETGPDMARSAIDSMNARRVYFRSVVDRVKSIHLAEAKQAKRAPVARPGAKKAQAGKAKKTRAAVARKPVRKKSAVSSASTPAQKQAAKRAGKTPATRSTTPARGRSTKRRK